MKDYDDPQSRDEPVILSFQAAREGNGATRRQSARTVRRQGTGGGRVLLGGPKLCHAALRPLGCLIRS